MMPGNDGALNLKKYKHMNPYLLLLFALVTFTTAFSQSAEYKKQKAEKLKSSSPFEAIVSREDNRELVYQDEWVVAFVPIRKQAPVHLLIVPKKRIYTMNDVEAVDATTLSSMLLAAKKLAQQYQVDKTGYRLVINTNENANQTVFHLHMHLLGGMPLGPAVSQTYSEK
jgi:histidine triad (HIT) family protein